MSQEKYNRKTEKKKHLKEKDRYQIEALLKALTCKTKFHPCRVRCGINSV